MMTIKLFGMKLGDKKIYNVDDNDDDFDAKDDDVDASQSSVQCSVSDHKLHSRVHHEVAVSDSDTEVEVFVDQSFGCDVSTCWELS